MVAPTVLPDRKDTTMTTYPNADELLGREVARECAHMLAHGDRAGAARLYARHTRAVRDVAQVTVCEELPVSSRWTIGQLEGWLTACADALRARVAVEGVPADARVIDGGRLVIW